jgi:indolepyruvate decarboxylase
MPGLGRALIDALAAHGAREIFGIPGDFVLPFFKVIEESGALPYYTLSHEPAVGSPPMRRRASAPASRPRW